jgi:hypothetical protein
VNGARRWRARWRLSGEGLAIPAASGPRGRAAHRVPGAICQEQHKTSRRVVADRRMDELRVARGAEIVDREQSEREEKQQGVHLES